MDTLVNGLSSCCRLVRLKTCTGVEKQSGGRREPDPDARKAHMLSAANNINYSLALPLAQGVRFDID